MSKRLNEMLVEANETLFGLVESLSAKVKVLEQQVLDLEAAADELHSLYDNQTRTTALAKELACALAKEMGLPAATFENYWV